MISETGHPSIDELNDAMEDIFNARAIEARATGRNPRFLPASIVVYPHWHDDYLKTAQEVGIDPSMEEAASVVNKWIKTMQ